MTVIYSDSRVKLDVKGDLLKLDTKIRRNLGQNMRRAMDGVKQQVVAATPALKAPLIRNGKVYRIPNVLKNAVSVRYSKNEAKDGNLGYFVNYKPLAGNKYRSFKTGNQYTRVLVRKSLRTSKKDNFNNPLDPYYWKFQEFGSKTNSPRRMLTGGDRGLAVAAQKTKDAIKRIIEQ